MSSLKRSVLFAVIVLGLSSTCALANEVDKKAKVERLMSLVNTQQLIDQFGDQTMEMVRQQVVTKELPEEARPYVDELLRKTAEMIHKRLNWERMKPEFVALYDETFSEEELDGMIAFYESPAGKAVLVKMPTLMQKSIQVGVKLMQGFEPELKAVVDEIMKKAEAAKKP